MSHVDYGQWAAYIHALFARFAPAATRIVDLACGTGNASFALHRLGYEVTGVDRSEAMLQVAREKSAGTNVEFVQQDLRQLGGLGPFDAATCLYDSVNYLLAPADIDAALRGAQGIVQPGGLFVFDICTERNSLRYFRNMRHSERGPGFSYERHSTYDPDRRLQRNHFRIHRDGSDVAFEETHVQRIYPVAAVANHVEASAWELLALCDGFTFDEGTEESDRVHFVLRAPPAEK
jgi:SAM-dependent methyltransferase